jgi:hypothetical protein
VRLPGHNRSPDFRSLGCVSVIESSVGGRIQGSTSSLSSPSTHASHMRGLSVRVSSLATWRRGSDPARRSDSRHANQSGRREALCLVHASAAIAMTTPSARSRAHTRRFGGSAWAAGPLSTKHSSRSCSPPPEQASSLPLASFAPRRSGRGCHAGRVQVPGLVGGQRAITLALRVRVVGGSERHRRWEGSWSRSCCWMLLVAVGRRRRCVVIVAVSRRGTRGCAIPLIRRASRRSCW